MWWSSKRLPYACYMNITWLLTKGNLVLLLYLRGTPHRSWHLFHVPCSNLLNFSLQPACCNWLSARKKSSTTTGNILNQDVHNLYFTTGFSMCVYRCIYQVEWSTWVVGHLQRFDISRLQATHPSLFRFRTRLRSQHRKPQHCRGMDLRCYRKIPEKGC